MTGKWRWILVVASMVVSALAVGIWVDSFDVTGSAVAGLLSRLEWWILAPLFALLAGHVALASWRWLIIESALGGEGGEYFQAFGFGGIAMALGTFLPPPLIYVSCRSLANKVSGASPVRGAVSGGIDQAADFAVVLMLSVPAAIAIIDRDMNIFILGAIGMVLAGLVSLLIGARSALVLAALERFCLGGLRDRGVLLRIYGLSLLRLANLTAITLLVAAACGEGDVQAIIIGVPLVTLAISLAMLPGALGVSEWSFSAVFGAFGSTQKEIVIFVLANRLLLTGLALLLGLLILVAMALRFSRSRSAERLPGNR